MSVQIKRLSGSCPIENGLKQQGILNIISQITLQVCLQESRKPEEYGTDLDSLPLGVC